MTKIKAEKQATDSPKNDKDFTWQRNMEKKYKDAPKRNPGSAPPEGTFSKSPSQIANDLKMHSKDYGQASRRLNSYINRQGRNLQGADRARLYDAKEHLKNAYGRPEHKPKQQTADSSAGPALYCLPKGHNLDDGTVDLLTSVPDLREKQAVNDHQLLAACARLKASVLNSEQDPNQRMSSVEVQSDSTAVPNLEETNIAESTSTIDGLDTAFEEGQGGAPININAALHRLQSPV